MSGYSRRVWACPFYRWDEKRRIHCEGGSVLAMPDRESYLAYARQYCGSASGWRGCSIARALERQWERAEEGKHGGSPNGGGEKESNTSPPKGG